MHPIEQELRTYADSKRAESSKKFFKTGKGDYGEGDVFIGVTVPQIRTIIKKYRDSSLSSIEELLQSPIHECRLAAVILLSDMYTKSKDDGYKQEILDLYLRNIDYINNWDIVDSSAHHIVGAYCYQAGSIDLLFTLSEREHLWAQRIAMVATWYCIKKGKTDVTFQLAEKLLHHTHDLLHKAVGWMLREAGKKDEAALRQFLDAHAATMPRTTLRYAIEKFSSTERAAYLQKT